MPARLTGDDAMFRALLESAPDPIVIVDERGCIVLVNSRVEEAFGYRREELVGRPIEVLVPERHRGSHASRRAGYSRDPRTRPMGMGLDLRARRKDGSDFPVDITLSPLETDHGRLITAIVRDMTEHRRAQERLRHLAEHDPLTGLLNRSRFEREVDDCVREARRYGGGALLLLDLDNFKLVNDTLGHAAGDELLRKVSSVLRRRLRDTDVLARLGGDEFAILLPRASRTQATRAAEAIVEALRRDPMSIGGQPVRLTASIGVATIGADIEDAGMLLMAADTAMYTAKAGGRNRVGGYDPRAASGAAADFSWTAQIRWALEHDGFCLYGQPIKDVNTGRVSHVEVLLRLRGPGGEIIEPGAFLPLAERTGLIREIDRWVLDEALRVLASEQAAGRSTRIEVNLSGASLGDPAVLQTIAKAVRSSGIDPSGLVLEITETAAIADLELARSFAGKLAALGCRFALDDFGTGFGSFTYLKHLPLHYLKIDGDFVRELAGSRTDQLMVDAIVSVAHGLGMLVVAEWVGDQDTYALLARYGVDYAQGFHVGPPAPIADVLAALQEPAAA